MVRGQNDIYLNREHSYAIKGALIILIVIGHNHVLCPNTESGGIMDYLYLFHVAGFFILPFFYDTQMETTWKGVFQAVIRCWIPYFWICILCFLVMCIMKHRFDFGWEHILAFFNGTQTPIRESFGFIFPWFLPTYCSFSIMLSFAKNYRWIYGILFGLAVCTFFMTWEQFYVLKNSVPFGIGLALNYFGVGVIAFGSNKYSFLAKYIGAVLFVAISVCWWMNVQTGILLNVLPSVFFLTLLCIVPYMNYGWLRILGRYSLGIYLFHVFFVNVTYILFPHTALWGWVGFMISLVIPLLMTMGIYRVICLRKLLFPRTWEELIHIGKTNNKVIHT